MYAYMYVYKYKKVITFRRHTQFFIWFYLLSLCKLLECNWNCTATENSLLINIYVNTVYICIYKYIYIYKCTGVYIYIYGTCVHIQVNTPSYTGNGCPFVRPYLWRVNKDMPFSFWSLQVAFDAAGVQNAANKGAKVCKGIYWKCRKLLRVVAWHTGYVYNMWLVTVDGGQFYYIACMEITFNRFRKESLR